MQIRLATIEDQDAVVALRAALWPEASHDEHGVEVDGIVTGHPRSTLPLVIFVAEHEGALVGFAEVGLRSHADGCDPSRPCGFLEGWYVQPAFQGQGIGRALVACAEQWAMQQGCTEFASDTWIDNEPSQHAHRALGFEVVDRCVNYRKTIPGVLPTDSSETASHYGSALARLHHEHFGMVAEAAATELLGRLGARGMVSGTIVDLAAGSGILSKRALEAGFDVWGVDISQDMLRLARSHAVAGQFLCGSLWGADVPPCVAVAAVGEAFCYAAAGDIPDLERLAERFQAIARVLVPGGLLLCDVAGPGRSGPSSSRQRVWEKDRTLLSLDEAEDPTALCLTRRINIFTPVGALHRRTQETHTLRLYRPEEVVSALECAGFAVERLKAYADFAFLPGWFGFAATRGKR